MCDGTGTKHPLMSLGKPLLAAPPNLPVINVRIGVEISPETRQLLKEIDDNIKEAMVRARTMLVG